MAISREWRGVLQALLAAAIAACASAQTPAASTFNFGFEQRVRNENWSNILDFDDARDDYLNQIRYRTRIWAKAPVSRTVDVFLGLGQETWQVTAPRKPYRFDEVIVENAYIDFKKLFVNGLSLRFGRQNLNKGEGFLMLEGGPYDGSRAIYFNAANLAYTRKQHKFEFFAISNPHTDRYFPRIHDKHRNLIEWDEKALGFYYTTQPMRRTALETYYFYKIEANDWRQPADPQYQSDRRLHTVGARVNRQVGETWSWNGEFAFQHGTQQPSMPVQGYAGYSYIRKTFHPKWRPAVTGGYWGLSGDNPATPGRIEGWDVMFARWPKWSEMYLYSLWKERGAGYWTNLSMWEAEFAAAPAKWLGLRATYYKMDSFHRHPANPAIFGMGTNRGHHFQGRADVVFGQNWRGHFVMESMLPGDFYRARGRAYFVRWEVIYTIQKRVAAPTVGTLFDRMLR